MRILSKEPCLVKWILLASEDIVTLQMDDVILRQDDIPAILCQDDIPAILRQDDIPAILWQNYAPAILSQGDATTSWGHNIELFRLKTCNVG